MNPLLPNFSRSNSGSAMLLSIHVHWTEYAYSDVIDWDSAEATSIDQFKLVLIDHLKHTKGAKSGLSEAVLAAESNLDQCMLFLTSEENGQVVQSLSDNMHIFIKFNTRSRSEETTSKKKQSQIVPKQKAASNTPTLQQQQQILAIAQQLNQVANEAFVKKKYNVSVEYFSKLLELGVDKLGCCSNLGTIYFICGVYDKAAKYLQMVIDQKHYDYKVFLSLADSYFYEKQYTKALENYNFANQVFEKVLSSSNAADGATKLRISEMKSDLTIKLGKTLYRLGEKEAGFGLISHVLLQDDQNQDALIEYAHVMIDRMDYDEALSVLLRCLVKDQNNKLVKAMLAGVIKNPKAGPKLLIQQLTNSTAKSSDIAPALAWIALIVKEHSAVEEAIVLYREALKIKPDNVSYMLNLVHTYELHIRYQEAIDECKKYLTLNSSASVGDLTAGEFVRFIEDVRIISSSATSEYRHGDKAVDFSNEMELQWVPNQGSVLVKKGSPAISIKAKTTEKHTVAQLDLLALYFTVVKILYVTGALSQLPPIISRLEGLRVGQQLHDTTIRNEHAYFCCISQIMTYLSKQLPIIPDAPPLYVCGESHCLSPAWQVIQMGEQKRTLLPVLVTGLKCWHMRPESDFYPKANFTSAIESIPDNEQVIFMFGEIDCREGIWLAVQKCRYKNLEEGIGIAIDIYLNELRKIQKKKNLDIYIHPVLPVLDVTRDTVKLFNRIMLEKLTKLNSKASSHRNRLKWLHFFDQLLTSDQKSLLKEYELDGTHIHPRYTPLLERALNEVLEQKVSK